jgi:hypothetical protein
MSLMPEIRPGQWPNERPKSAEELHRDRITLLVVVLIFAAVIGLVIWAALVGPPPQGGSFQMPVVP